MRILSLLALAACGHAAAGPELHDRGQPRRLPIGPELTAAAIKWIRVPAATAKDLTSVGCTSTGDVYAIDDAGDLHDLRGHAATPAADPAMAAAAQIKLPDTVPYGRGQIHAVARDGAHHVYALGRYLAIGNSLEEDYAYLLRSDDGGAAWAAVWTGPDVGPMNMAHRRDPDVGGALAALPTGVALASIDGAVLISSDFGKTFERRGSVTAPLNALWASPTGVLYGVGPHGEIAISTDGGETFDTTHEGDADLAAITGCGDEIWIVGARGTVLSRRSR